MLISTSMAFAEYYGVLFPSKFIAVAFSRSWHAHRDHDIFVNSSISYFATVLLWLYKFSYLRLASKQAEGLSFVVSLYAGMLVRLKVIWM